MKFKIKLTAIKEYDCEEMRKYYEDGTTDEQTMEDCREYAEGLPDEWMDQIGVEITPVIEKE